MAEASSAPASTPASALIVTVAYCTAPGVVQEMRLTVPDGSTVGSALLACGFAHSADALPQVPPLPARQVGIWGKVCPMERQLKDGDRVEIYRQLVVDPKVARRERFVRQGSRGAGLFAKDRRR